VATIIVKSNESADQDSVVTLSENVQPEHLASKHHAAQLIERVGWAVTDADARRPSELDRAHRLSALGDQ
jgi:hypothetical protein